jgi:hypothetical protein
MRTTLDIDDDVLQAARELAKRRRGTVGKLLSELARKGLTASPPDLGVKEPPSLYGFRPFPSRGGILTNEMIDRIREDDVY